MAKRNRHKSPAARGRYRRDSFVERTTTTPYHQRSIPEANRRKLIIERFANGYIRVRTARTRRGRYLYMSENSRQLHRASILRPSALTNAEIRERRFGKPCRLHATCNCNDNMPIHEEAKRIELMLAQRRQAERRRQKAAK